MKLSAKWASKELGCTLKHIIAPTGCGGVCCRTPSYYPPKANGGKCVHLGPKGCTLKPADKPIKCLLYPFVINTSDTIVLHGRALTGTCKPCYKKDKTPVIEHLEENMAEIFGESTAKLMVENTRKGIDTKIVISQELREQLLREQHLEELNVNPIPRQGFGSKNATV